METEQYIVEQPVSHSKTILNKESNSGGIIISDIKLYIIELQQQK
jgi:hypothetical protein